MPVIPNLKKDDFAKFVSISTRWSDNDIYLHVNNVVYFSFFDTAVNQNLVQNGHLHFESSSIVGLVVNNQCQFFDSITFPDVVHVGISIEKIGNSSVTYRLGIFKNDAQTLAALGIYTHVYVNRDTHQPTPIPDDLRAFFTSMLISQ
jgi:acyl-CoA thioester hydrolase